LKATLEGMNVSFSRMYPVPIPLVLSRAITTIVTVGKALVVMFVMTILCTVIWSYCVTDVLYNCTDAVGFDYLRPGDWVHEFAGLQVVTVDHVDPNRSMSEPDTIRAGWTVGRLWLLWLGFLGASLLTSFLIARLRWFHEARADADTRPETANCSRAR
jgi:hypothetical protein